MGNVNFKYLENMLIKAETNRVYYLCYIHKIIVLWIDWISFNSLLFILFCPSRRNMILFIAAQKLLSPKWNGRKKLLEKKHWWMISHLALKGIFAQKLYHWMSTTHAENLFFLYASFADLIKMCLYRKTSNLTYLKFLFNHFVLLSSSTFY